MPSNIRVIGLIASVVVTALLKKSLRPLENEFDFKALKTRPK